MELLKKYVNEGEDFVNVTDEHIQQVYTSIIDKADELQEQLDAYDESTPDLLVWFYKKYNEKQPLFDFDYSSSVIPTN